MRLKTRRESGAKEFVRRIEIALFIYLDLAAVTSLDL